jgi:hypothetical protein
VPGFLCTYIYIYIYRERERERERERHAQKLPLFNVLVGEQTTSKFDHYLSLNYNNIVVLMTVNLSSIYAFISWMG